MDEEDNHSIPMDEFDDHEIHQDCRCNPQFLDGFWQHFRMRDPDAVKYLAYDSEIYFN